jgi:hypothetical protein
MSEPQLDWSAVGRAMQARRRREERVCAACGQAFSGLAWQRFCSRRCKERDASRAYRERQRSRAQSTPAEEPASPAVGTAAPTPIGQGARVVLRQSLADVPANAIGRVVELDGKHAVVHFDRYSQPRRVAVAWLAAAPGE